jgi:hypothetical protein
MRDGLRRLDQHQGRNWTNVANSGDLQLAYLKRAVKFAELHVFRNGLDDLGFDRVPEAIEKTKAVGHIEESPFSLEKSPEKRIAPEQHSAIRNVQIQTPT